MLMYVLSYGAPWWWHHCWGSFYCDVTLECWQKRNKSRFLWLGECPQFFNWLDGSHYSTCTQWSLRTVKASSHVENWRSKIWRKKQKMFISYSYRGKKAFKPGPQCVCVWVWCSFADHAHKERKRVERVVNRSVIGLSSCTAVWKEQLHLRLSDLIHIRFTDVDGNHFLGGVDQAVSPLQSISH